MLMRTPLLLLAMALLTAGCQDAATAPSADAHDAAPAAVISDGAHDGTAGFYFLPPMVPVPAYGGTFDATLAPTVTVLDCGTDPDCAAPDATPHALFTGATGPVIDPVDEHYKVNWHTNETGAVAGRYYRVVVAAHGADLGFADVQMVDGGKQLKNVDTDEYVGLTDGRTLPVRFRIETGAAEPPPPPPPTPVAPSATADEYSLVAGTTLTVPAATGLLANDLLGTPGATIVAVLGADDQPLGSRTVLGGVVSVDLATGAFTLTGAIQAGTEYFQYQIGNAAGTSIAAIDITVTPGAAAAMSAASGDGQSVAAGATVPILPTVRVVDAYGNAVGGVSVGFAVTSGAGSADGTASATDVDGLAAVGSWTLGTAGTNTLQATSTGLAAVDFTATALASCAAGTPASSVVTPAATATVTNTGTATETRSVTVLVTDDCGNPVPNVAVAWSATGSVYNASDAVSPAATTTGSDGTSTVAWTYYYLCHNRTISAAVAGLPAATFTYTFSSCSSGGGGGIRR
jgi:hypothetical protein